MRLLLTIVLLSLTTVSPAQQSRSVSFFNTVSFNGSTEENSTNYIRSYSDGGWVACSFIKTGSKYRIVLFRYDACGEQVFSRKYTATKNVFRIGDMIIDDEGAILITGYHGDIISDADIFALKIDPYGDLLWSKIYSNGAPNYTYSIGQLSNGNYFINGNKDYSQQNTAYNFLLNIDRNGNVLNAKEYVPTVIWGKSIPTTDGGVIARTGSIIYKTDQSGNLDWMNTYYFSSYTMAPVEVADGYIFARWRSKVGNREAHVFKLSKSGDLMWSTEVDTVISNATLSFHPNGFIVRVATKLKQNRNMIAITIYTPEGKKVKESLYAPDPSIDTYMVTDHTIATDGSLLISGYAIKGGQSTFFTAKTTKALTLNCGEFSRVVVPGVTINMSKNPASPGVTSSAFTASDENVTVEEIAVNESMTCFELEDPPEFMPVDTIMCLGSTVVLNADYPDAEYLWHDGSTDDSFTASNAGNYWVDINVCNISTRKIFVVDETSCNCTVYVPNAFTPNGNSRNDLFQPVYDCDFSDYKLKIFNRWGQLVFETDDSTIGWDGTYKSCRSNEFRFCL